MTEDPGGTLIAAHGIHKRYGGITALDDVSLGVRPAEIHALVGENGAGKSTLVKIMTGAETSDAGEVRILGEEVGALTPEKAREWGVGAVYQEPSLVPGLTVLENLFLGRELRPTFLGAAPPSRVSIGSSFLGPPSGRARIERCCARSRS